jgi:hypothetical protein
MQEQRSKAKDNYLSDSLSSNDNILHYQSNARTNPTTYKHTHHQYLYK